jgi:glutaredoxin-like protein NrdH
MSYGKPVVYSKPKCPQCVATYRAMDRKGIEYDVVDLTASPDAVAMIRELGYQQAPVVVAGSEHWAGFRPDKVAALADALVAA